MANSIFTPDFYKKLYKEIEKYLENDYCAEYSDEAVAVSLYWHDDDTDSEYEVELTAEVENEWYDESFDHAFGTWYDPCPYYKYGGLIDIDDVTVYVNGEKVEGFSRDGFYAQFEIPEHNGIKAGDKVIYFEKNKWSDEAYEVRCYDTFSKNYVLKDASGKDIYKHYVKVAA